MTKRPVPEVLLAMLPVPSLHAQANANWSVCAGDAGAAKYFTLRDTNLDNVAPFGVDEACGLGYLPVSTEGRSTIYALHSQTLWSAGPGRNAYPVPMTYRTRSGRQIVVVSVRGATGSKLVACDIPGGN